MITIYSLAFNEEVFIQFFIDHYRTRFPNCNIVIYDNMSTDKTVEIAKSNNCTVIPYDTNNQISDRKYLEIKNNCWKNAQTDWVLVCDMDELLDVNQQDLEEEDKLSTTIIKSQAFNMINMEDNFDLKNIKYGSRCEPYDKSYCFKKSVISEINYTPGCHTCMPRGQVKYSNHPYILWHYKSINPDYQIARYKLYESRLSPDNRKNGWGNHYSQSEETIKNGFKCWREAAIKIIEE